MILIKAHVKQHTRTLPSGKVVVVRAHEDKRQKKAASGSFDPGQRVKDKWGDWSTIVGPDPKDSSRLILREDGTSSTVSVPISNLVVARPLKAKARPSGAPKATKSGIKWPDGGREPVILRHDAHSSEPIEVMAGYAGKDAGLVDTTPSYGLFDGIFAGPRGGMDGENIHAVVLDPDKILTHSQFNQLNYDDYSKIAKELHPEWSEEQIERAWDYAAEEKEPFTEDESDFEDLFGGDVAEASWMAQGFRGAIARKLGYHAVEMKDETGISTQVLSGAKTIPAEKGESFDQLERRIYSLWKEEVGGDSAGQESLTKSCDIIQKSMPIPVLTRDHEPTEGQIKAGNYRKPKRRFAGLDVSIENPAGSYRRGQDRAGKTWETRMLYDYGYIRGSLGVDGDHVDCYLGPNEDAPMAYIVHQRCYGDWDKFDEDKCMLGFDSQEDAEAAYLKHYDDPRFLGPVTAMPMDEFRAKVRATKEAPQMIKAMPLILKAYVRAHTRKLGSGKVIQVRGYTDKRVKKPTAASNDKQLSFNLEDTYDGIETREGTTDQQIELGKAAVKSLAQHIVGVRHSGEQAPTLLGVRLAKGFTEKGNVNLVGQKIGSPADLAALAQVYRDPRFETFRMIYTKRGRVVGETAYSSRLPGSVSFHDDIDDEVRRDKEGFGADGYYMLHNHPSGSAAPSNADKLFTKAIASAVPGFKAHVVIDHNEYGVIDSHGDDSVVQDEALGGIDLHGDPSLDHDLLGMSVTDPASAAVVGKRLEALGQAEAPVLVMTQGRRAEVSLIASVPSATIRRLSEKGGETKARAWLRRVGSKTGSGSNIFLSVSDTDMERLSGELRNLVVSGLVTDVVSSSGVSLRALRIHPHERDPFSYSPRKARRVLVGAKGGPLRKALPLVLKAHVPAHTRRLKSGKVIVVRAYDNKRVKKPAPGSSDKQIDMFVAADEHGEVPPAKAVFVRKDERPSKDEAMREFIADSRNAGGVASNSQSSDNKGESNQQGGAMKFDTLDLQDPETYANNPELATLARRVAEANWKPGDMSRGDFKREVLAGKHPELVRAALEKREQEKKEAAAAAEKGAQAAVSADLPDGYSVTVEGDDLIVSGPFDDDLHERIKRAGGRWDGKAGTNRRAWIVPASKGTSLKRVLSNWVKANQGKMAAEAEARKAADEAKAKARAEAPKVEPGTYGPFTVKKSIKDPNRLVVSFRYDPDLVSAVKEAKSAKFNPNTKSWLVDKSDGAKLLDILNRGAALAEKKAAQAEKAQQEEAARRKAAAEAEAADRERKGISTAYFWSDGSVRDLPSVGETIKRGDEYHVVTEVSRGRYYGDDAMSFGGTDDRPYQHRVMLRRATDEERASHMDREAKESAERRRKQEAKRAIDSVIGDIRTAGTMPEKAEPKGETILNTFTAYGTGDMIVIDDDRIWYIKNNGMDGDDWSRNNVATGGAGGIGWYVPKTPEMERRIREAVRHAD